MINQYIVERQPSIHTEIGTHVAGTIAAIDNDEGVIGVYPGAPGMKIMKVFSGQNCRWSYASDLVRAVQQCASSGSKIVTMSLGGYRSSSLERDAFQKLFENEGILFVAAAGNGGNSRYSFPASYPFVMSVGAIDARNTVATFSQFNNQVDISGPGVRVQSTTGSDSYSFYSGTSMATPHVSGVALLLWNKHPSCSNKNIRSALEESAKDLGAPGRDDYYGHGAVRYNEADKVLKGNLCGQRTPAPTPVPTPSCMSGETGLVAMNHSDRIGNKRSFRAISEGTSEHDTTQHIVKVKDLKLHDAIYGLDESKKPTVCRVEAVGNFGFGPVYGNYTDGHYTFNPDTGNVETHGQNGVLSVQDKYIVFTSCPVGVDEAGVKFTPFDTDFFGELMREMSWSNYLHLHSAILRIVRKSGDFWFHGSSYKNLSFLQEHAPILCSAILQCMKDNDDCHVVEDASIAFIENVLVDHAKDKAYEAFQNIGQHRRLESTSATITGGGSVRK